MRLVFALLAVAIALGPAVARAEHPVATVLGETLIHEAVPPAGDSPAAHIAQLLHGRVLRHFVAQHGLEATSAELAELADYHAEFERRDRAQRARKLADLDQRLASDALDKPERAHLEEFRTTLKRLAAYEADEDRKARPDARERAATYAPWIEMWKAHRVLYERFGGVVGLVPFGHYPYGAWAALIAEYERSGALEFHDAAMRERVMGLFNLTPRIVIAPHAVDFAPYWRKPIPPSYFADETPPLVEKRDQ